MVGGPSPTASDTASVIARNFDLAVIPGQGQPCSQAFPESATCPSRRKEPPQLTISLTASGAVAGVSVPVAIAFYPPAAIPLAILLAITMAIVVWHLRRGGRATVRRTPKGTFTFTLDSTRRIDKRGSR